MSLFPGGDGTEEENDGYISPFLSLESRKRRGNMIHYQVFVMGAIGDDIATMFSDGSRCFKQERASFGGGALCRRETLFNNLYLHDGKLRIHCRVTYAVDSLAPSPPMTVSQTLPEHERK